MSWLVVTWGDEGFGVATNPQQADTAGRPLDHGALQQLFPQPSATEALPPERQPVVTCYWNETGSRWCFAARGLGGVTYGSAGTFHYVAAPPGLALADAWSSYFGAGGATRFPGEGELTSATLTPALPATDPTVEQLLVLAFGRPTLGELGVRTAEFVDAVWWVASMLPEKLLRGYRWTTLHLGEYREKLSVLAVAWPTAYADAWPKGRSRLGPVTTPEDVPVDPEARRCLAWLSRSAASGRFPARQRSDSSFDQLVGFLKTNRPLSEEELEALWFGAEGTVELRFEPGLLELPEATLRSWAVEEASGIRWLPRLANQSLRAEVLSALLADRRTHGKVLGLLAAEASGRTGPLTLALRDAAQAGSVRAGDPAREVVLELRDRTPAKRITQWLDDLGVDPGAFEELLPLDTAQLVGEARRGQFIYLRSQLNSARRDQLLPALVDGLADRPRDLGAAGAELAGAGFEPGHLGRRLAAACPSRPHVWLSALTEGLASHAKGTRLKGVSRYHLAWVILEALAEHGLEPGQRLSRAIVQLTFAEAIEPRTPAPNVASRPRWRPSLTRRGVLLLRWLLILSVTACLIVAIWFGWQAIGGAK